MKFLITGGAGFIGSSLVRIIINDTNHTVINLDKLTYAGNLSSLKSVSDSKRYIFEKGDICNKENVRRILDKYQPDILMHLAAESHVDRSIDGPEEFINTNIIGTFVLLEEVKHFSSNGKEILFHHISTDEVFGDLEDGDTAFNEYSPYLPSSPYSASKASSDHLVRAWGRTYNIPYIITNCSNNFGPFQFPEKLIPNTILKALNDEKIPIFGDGKQIRDWLYVDDHSEALLAIAQSGKKNETFNIGTKNTIDNLTIVKQICTLIDEISPRSDGSSRLNLITFVKDRPGHDKHYAIDPTKLHKEIGWQSKRIFKDALKDTVLWYLNNAQEVEEMMKGESSLNRIGLNIRTNN